MEKKSTELAQAQFPALYLCVVIDARHGSRQDILKDLKASNLFETMVEAKSLDDGLKILQYHTVDACILGPSVSPSKAATIVEKAKTATLSEACAFIAVVNQDVTYEAELIAAGAHRVIKVPCTKMAFSEGLVRGVVAANAGSSWSGILINAELNSIDMFGVVKREPPDASTPPSAQPPPMAAPESAAPAAATVSALSSSDAWRTIEESGDATPGTLATLFSKIPTELKRVMQGIERGEFGLGADGKPTAETAEAISSLVERILPEGDLNSRPTKVKSFLESALVQWFLDLKTYGQKDASSELRRTLASYKE